MEWLHSNYEPYVIISDIGSAVQSAETVGSGQRRAHQQLVRDLEVRLLGPGSLVFGCNTATVLGRLAMHH